MKERIENLETKLYERNRQHEALEKKAAVQLCVDKSATVHICV
jgi:hypothetical protein